MRKRKTAAERREAQARVRTEHLANTASRLKSLGEELAKLTAMIEEEERLRRESGEGKPH